MYFTHSEIPAGSFELCGFKGGEAAVNSTDIDLTLNLIKEEEGVFEVSQALGDMSRQSNIDLGFKCWSLGVRHLNFHALKGTKVTQWAVYLKSDEHFDYYTVDLEAAIARYQADPSLGDPENEE